MIQTMRGAGMTEKTFETIQNYVCGNRALQNIRGIANYHRIQASPGYRESALYCTRELKKAGIQCRLLSYPADGSSYCWTQKLFKEWSCESAYLDLVDEQELRLCDFGADAISVIQRSAAIDFAETPLELVVMDKGCDPAAYDPEELKGRLLLVNTDVSEYIGWAIKDYQAAGLISDRVMPVKGVRDRGDLYDSRMYQSFWYMGGEDQTLASGFVLTPRQGDLLRQKAAEQLKRHKEDPTQPKYLRLKGRIASELYTGEIEVVEAVIPGQTQEEIIIVAHLCHPKASANDNASGAAGGIEALRAISALIGQGKLAVPKRSIRLILVPEMTGTYAYLSSRERELGRIKAGINLDMIGASQSSNIAPITITGLPNALPSFVQDLAVEVLGMVKRECKGFNGGDIALFMSEISEYSGGSDHYIMSDPTVGIPCVMLGQWPDRWYHTNLDTPDKIDPAILKRSITIAASYAYTLATLCVEDVPLIMNTARGRFAAKTAEVVSRAISSNEHTDTTALRIQYACEIACHSVEDFKRFFAGEELLTVRRMIADERRHLIRLAKEIADRTLKLFPGGSTNQPIPLDDRFKMVPVRLFRGPIRLDFVAAGFSGELLTRYHALKPTIKEMDMALDVAIYWTDSKRSMTDIIRKVFLDTGYAHTDKLMEVFEFLEDAGFIRLR